MHRVDIINRLISHYGFKRYLEIGIEHGGTFNAIRCNDKTGVDPVPCENIRNDPRIVKKTSDAFFATYTGPDFDMIFVDGLHHAYQVKRDVENSLLHLSPNGIILCHDMAPENEIDQTVPRVTDCWTGDCWKALSMLRRDRPELDIFTLNTDLGCAIVTYRTPLICEFEDSELTWDLYKRCRSELLNLRPPEYLEEWIKCRDMTAK